MNITGSVAGSASGMLSIEGEGDKIDVTQVLTEGTKIATITINEGTEEEETIDLYAPDYGADIAALDDRLDTTEDNITNISGRMTEAENDIREINSALSNLNTTLLWDGNKYTTGNMFLSSPLKDGDLVVVTFRAFSTSYVSQYIFKYLKSFTDSYQFSFWGDASQFARYRLKVKTTNVTDDTILIEDVINGASNNGLLRIHRIMTA